MTCRTDTDSYRTHGTLSETSSTAQRSDFFPGGLALGLELDGPEPLPGGRLPGPLPAAALPAAPLLPPEASFLISSSILAQPRAHGPGSSEALLAPLVGGCFDGGGVLPVGCSFGFGPEAGASPVVSLRQCQCAISNAR